MWLKIYTPPQKKCVRFCVSRRLCHFCRRNSIQVFEYMFSVKRLEFGVFPNHLFFFLHLYIIQVSFSSALQIKIILAQGCESTLISLGDFQRCMGDRGCTRLTIQFIDDWVSNTMGTSDDEGRTRGLVQILLYFDHIWVLVLCAPSSNDVSVLLLNLPTEIMKRTLMTRSIPTGVFSFWVVWSSFHVPVSFNFIISKGYAETGTIVLTQTRTFFKSNNFSRHHFPLVIRTPWLLVRRTADIRNKDRPLLYTCTELSSLHPLILLNVKPDTQRKLQV